MRKWGTCIVASSRNHFWGSTECKQNFTSFPPTVLWYLSCLEGDVISLQSLNTTIQNYVGMIAKHVTVGILNSEETKNKMLSWLLRPSKSTQPSVWMEMKLRKPVQVLFYYLVRSCTARDRVVSLFVYQCVHLFREVFSCLFLVQKRRLLCLCFFTLHIKVITQKLKMVSFWP